MKKSIERKILERMPIDVIIQLQDSDISEIFGIAKSTVSLIMTKKIKNRKSFSCENLISSYEDEKDIEVKYPWKGSKEQQISKENQLKNKI